MFSLSSSDPTTADEQCHKQMKAKSSTAIRQKYPNTSSFSKVKKMRLLQIFEGMLKARGYDGNYTQTRSVGKTGTL